MKFLLSFIVVTASCITLGLLVLYLLQNKLIYPAPHLSLDRPSANNLEQIDLADTYAYLLTPSGYDKPYPLIIYTHGNGELAELWIEPFAFMVENGYAVLLIEYPGYGRARGQSNYNSIKETMLLAYDTVTKLPYIDTTKIIAHGRSLGGAAACLLAENRTLSALVLESTFSSLTKVVKEYGFPSFLLKDRYDNAAIIRDLTIPILIYHGTEDRVIAFSHAETLNHANETTKLIQKKCGHNDCPTIWFEMLSFFDIYLHSKDNVSREFKK